jgi:predicted amidohydrolase
MSGTEITVACAQVDAVLGDLDANIEITSAAVREAAVDHGAALVVLPECASSGYVFESAAEAGSVAQDAETGPTIAAWTSLSRELGTWICGGFVERSGDAIYNSAALVGPDGTAAVYRKVHLWNSENDLYSKGDLGFPVADTPFGRVGMMICYDAWFPESVRSSAVGGADIVCAPSDWIPNPLQPPGPTLAEMMIVTAAHSNQLYIAASSRVGTERGVDFIGSSLIADHEGWLLAGPAPERDSVVVTARVDPIGSREARRTNPFNRPLHDRRPASYRS